MKYLQRLGKSLMLPVAILPIAAIFIGISNWIFFYYPDNIIANILSSSGLILLDNIPLLFAVGISIGMSVKGDGTAALSGLVSWLVIVTLLSPKFISVYRGIDIDMVDPAFDNVKNVFVGIICGLIASFSYNKFHKVKLPAALSFFSGKRSVAIIAGTFSLLLAIILIYIWPLMYDGLQYVGKGIATLGPIGAGIYGMLNRLLIPVGLHHAVNSVFWFDIVGINDLKNFSDSTGVFGVTGQYMTGYYPIMMFGLPGAALAMYHTAKSKNKKIVSGLLLGSAIASFFTGVTEPLEFSFMFLSPFLYVIHAIFTGISMLICYILPVRMGFVFSAGLIDLVLYWRNALAQNPWILPLLGIGWFFIYYFTFRFFIVKFNLKTLGREDDAADNIKVSNKSLSFHNVALGMIKALGGKNNIIEIDNCVTRIRITVKKASLIDEAMLKLHGSKGFIKLSNTEIQIIIGLDVQFLADAIKNILDNNISETQNIKSEGVEEPNIDSTEQEVIIFSPLSGKLVKIQDVPDITFSESCLGNGVAIIPDTGDVFAPFDAVIEQIYDSSHAIVLTNNSGVTVLIHIGLDTIKLDGRGFKTFVAVGDKVKMGDIIIRADLDLIKEENYNTITPIVVIESDKYSMMEQVDREFVKAKEKIISLKIKDNDRN